MRAQLSAEILVGMAVTLLVVLTLLHCFAGAGRLISSTRSALSGMANAVGSYPARLPSG